MKRSTKITYYVLLLSAIFALLYFGADEATKEPPHETYMRYDKKEFGCYLTHHFLDATAGNNAIANIERDIYTQLAEFPLETTNYIFINRSFDIGEPEFHKLDTFVKQGNNVFISAINWPQFLLDTFNLTTAYAQFSFNNFKFEDSVQLLLNNKESGTLNYFFSNTNFFIDDSEAKELGTGDSQANFIEIRRGEGRFYMHSSPFIFTNANFVEKHNYKYIYTALSHLPQANIWWDEYYKIGRPNDMSIYKYLKSNKYLNKALWAVSISLLLLVFFGLKRVQQIIPIWKPKQNLTIDYVNSLGNLYFEKGANREQVEGRLKNLKTFLWMNYNITFDEYSNAEEISNKTGVDIEILKKIQTYLATPLPEQVSDERLHNINKLLEKFYNHINQTI